MSLFLSRHEATLRDYTFRIIVFLRQPRKVHHFFNLGSTTYIDQFLDNGFPADLVASDQAFENRL